MIKGVLVQKTIGINLDRRKAMENIRDLAFLGASFSMLYNISNIGNISFLPNEAIKMENPYQKYLAFNMEAFYVPNNLASLLKIQKLEVPLYINVLLNSDTKYKPYLMQYAIDATKEENTIYSLENSKQINETFKNLETLQKELQQRNIYLNFLDLEDKNSLLGFYNFLLKNENLKQYFYFENNRFYEKAKQKDEFYTHTNLELYTMLLNEFETLSKFTLINILEILAMNNLTALLTDKQQHKEYRNLSNFVMNLRLKA